MQVLYRDKRHSLHVYAKFYSKLRALNPNEWLEPVWFTSFLKVNRKGALSKCHLYKFYGHRFAYAKGGRMGMRGTGNVSPRTVFVSSRRNSG